MARKPRVPAYRRHSSGQARVTLTDASGKRHDHLLGPYGSPESYQEYERNHRVPAAPRD